MTKEGEDEITVSMFLGLNWWQSIWWYLSKSYRNKIKRELKPLHRG